MGKAAHFIKKSWKRTAIDEFLAKEFKAAEYGGVQVRGSPMGDRLIVYVGRVGMAIGSRGKTIRAVTQKLRETFDLDNPEIKELEVPEPELNAKVMAGRLASSLERGRHFRRSGHGVIRRIMASGALGAEITLTGKITSQRARLETFRSGFVAKSGHPSQTMVDHGFTIVVGKRGALGVQCRIMRADSKLPDDINVIAPPTATSMVVQKMAEAEEELQLEATADAAEMDALSELEDIEELDLGEDVEEGEDLDFLDIEETVEEVDIVAADAEAILAATETDDKPIAEELPELELETEALTATEDDIVAVEEEEEIVAVEEEEEIVVVEEEEENVAAKEEVPEIEVTENPAAEEEEE